MRCICEIQIIRRITETPVNYLVMVLLSVFIYHFNLFCMTIAEQNELTRKVNAWWSTLTAEEKESMRQRHYPKVRMFIFSVSGPRKQAMYLLYGE